MTIGQISDIETAKNVKVVNTAPIHVQLVGTVTTDSTGDPLLTDSETGALVIIQSDHHEIHTGDTYLVSYKSPDASPIADNGTVVIILTTSTKEIHMVYDHACGGDSEFELSEGPTVTAATGTPMTPQNKNRNFSNANVTTALRDPTVTNIGVLIENTFAPGGTGPTAGGGIGGSRNEWELKPNTKYMFRVTNRSGNNQPISIRIEWYHI